MSVLCTQLAKRALVKNLGTVIAWKVGVGYFAMKVGCGLFFLFQMGKSKYSLCLASNQSKLSRF